MDRFSLPPLPIIWSSLNAVFGFCQRGRQWTLETSLDFVNMLTPQRFVVPASTPRTEANTFTRRFEFSIPPNCKIRDGIRAPKRRSVGTPVRYTPPVFYWKTSLVCRCKLYMILFVGVLQHAHRQRAVSLSRFEPTVNKIK